MLYRPELVRRVPIPEKSHRIYYFPLDSDQVAYE